MSGPPASSAAARRRMQANRRRDSRPERQLRSALHGRGLRYRVDRPLLAAGRRVRPDLVFIGAKVAVFVDGCFWHGCPEHGTMPKANRAYWREKLAANVARDRKDDDALRGAGWVVHRVWSHEDPGTAAAQIEMSLALKSSSREPA